MVNEDPSDKLSTSQPALTPKGPTGYKPKPHPFKVANTIAPIPARLVQLIQALEYVEMRELLPDNIALAERLVALPQGLAPHKPPGEREIGRDRALATWVSLFATYVAIVATAHSERVGDMLAYLHLVVWEASKFGGDGWLTYDAVSSQPGRVVGTLELPRHGGPAPSLHRR